MRSKSLVRLLCSSIAAVLCVSSYSRQRLSRNTLSRASRSEERYRRLFEHAAVGIIIASRDQLRILELNQAASRMLGVEANIQTATIPDKGVWYRVRLGPYKSADDLNRASNFLKQNGVDSTPMHAQ